MASSSPLPSPQVRPRRTLLLVLAAMLLTALACAMPGAPSSSTSAPEAPSSPAQQGQDDQRTLTRQAPSSATASTSSRVMPGGEIAFFFQTVGQMSGGEGTNAVRVATTTDMKTVRSAGLDAASWRVNVSQSGTGLGDPVFSRLSDGSWTMTSWRRSSTQSTRHSLVFYQGACPFVREEDAVVLGVSKGKGCANVNNPIDGKTSQVFEHEGEGYMVVAIQSELHLAKVISPGRSVGELDGICVAPRSIDDVSQLAFGATVPIVRKDDTGGMRLSDAAIGRRADGTWVLYAKGMPSNLKCDQASICELCARGIYRSTSTDLVRWSKLERVVEQASVPEAVTLGDGTIWLYWQDFSKACSTGDLRQGSVAPVAGAYELPGSYELSEPIQVQFSGESRLADASAHLPTNANPIYLPDQAAVSALEACVSSGASGATIQGGTSAPAQGSASAQQQGANDKATTGRPAGGKAGGKAGGGKAGGGKVGGTRPSGGQGRPGKAGGGVKPSGQ